MKNPKILIVRPDRIGDVVLSTPLPREIKKTYPDSHISILLREYTKDLYLNNPHVNEIIIYAPDENPVSLIRKLRSGKFDFALTLLPTERLNWILFFTGIRNRVGVGHKFYQFVTNSKSVFRNKYIPLRHETDYCLDEIRKLGIETSNLDSEIFLSEEEKKKAVERKNEFCPNGERLIGINSTSGNSSPNIRFEEYFNLIKKLTSLSSLKIAVTDLVIPDEISRLPRVIYLNVGNNLRDSIINFSILDLLISSSTGPMHIAAALKVKTVSMFCPLTACSPKLWGPRGNEAKIILPEDNYCQAFCPGDPKVCRFEGTGGIDANMIFEIVKSALS